MKGILTSVLPVALFLWSAASCAQPPEAGVYSLSDEQSDIAAVAQDGSEYRLGERRDVGFEGSTVTSRDNALDTVSQDFVIEMAE